ncbi:DUF952 domain-containing protein [Breoghania sp.]|uniref:DUF952 domain-containing protein n=1 Tax=Breoghania sp. TaxID=2065378 RepID=UPI0029CAAA5F|nr:DUF952 domain-containing protein [Breoghania sp.]
MEERVSTVYKISPRLEWEAAVAAGVFHGAPIDLQDGFIHFSSADQVRETAAKHFAGQDDLVLVAIPADALGEDLKWEVSRGGALFPHLYATLDPALAAWAVPLPLNNAGAHVFPELEA